MVEAARQIGQALIKPLGRGPCMVEQARPLAGPGQVVLRVVCVGLCRTDLLVASDQVAAGKDSLVLGHEFCGLVEDVGTGVEDAPALGSMVAVDPTWTRVDGSDGFMGRDRDGCLATWVAVDANRVLAVSPGLAAPLAAYLEPVAAALGGVLAALEVPGLGSGGILVGDNRIATLTASILRSHGLEFVHISHAGLREWVAGGVDLHRADWLLESGLCDDLLSLAAEVLRAGGTVVLKSRHRELAHFPARRWAEKQLNIAARSRSDFARAMAWLVSNTDSVLPLLGRAYRLNDWQSAFAEANGGEMGKTFLVPESALELFAQLGGPALHAEAGEA